MVGEARKFAELLRDRIALTLLGHYLRLGPCFVATVTFRGRESGARIFVTDIEHKHYRQEYSTESVTLSVLLLHTGNHHSQIAWP